MTIVVPTVFTALIGRDEGIYRRGVIKASAIGVAAENAHHAYAHAGLQTPVQIRGLRLGVTTTYEVVARGFLEFGGQRELRGLNVVWGVSNVDLQIRLTDTAGAVISTTALASASSTDENSSTITAPGASYPKIFIEVRARRNIPSPSLEPRIHYLRVWERAHNATTLPSS